MSALLFLTVGEVMEIHCEQLELYGGESGVRDVSLLESALAVPQSGMGGEYFHSSLFDMAAAYLYHIVQNHPFVDGNKRTGTACAYLFLAINGLDLDCDPDELTRMVLEVAGGGLDKTAIAAFIRLHTTMGGVP